MNKRVLKQLVFESYTEGALDQQKVTRIAAILKRKELKDYIRALKIEEKKSTVIVTLPDNDQYTEDELKKLFPNKNILFEKEPDLLIGARIMDNDLVYEFNLKNTLEKMIQYIDENYD